MKKKLHQILIATVIVIASFSASKAQTISDFENLTLSKSDTFWNGASHPGTNTFTSGNAIFLNSYSSFGYWESGWAYSNKLDSTTSGYTNEYATKALKGYNGSLKYAVAQQGAKVKLTGNGAGKVVSGFYVSNGTYAYNSMKSGDMFAKKFGGVSGNDPDWFLLTIKKYNAGVLATDSVNFYLADYRFSNNAQDYIVKNWAWVDLTTLGNVDSLYFNLRSSDVGAFGMNTPAFFCMDNFTTADVLLNVATMLDNKINVQLYPNPANHQITINAKINVLNAATVSIYNTLGALVLTSKISAETSEISISNLPNGSYTIVIENGNFRAQNSFIKQ
jgi:Domain of unknown function (DUF4465)/Secretion system C-terminal sorting domain